MNSYERLIITNVMYVPIETKINDFHYENNNLSFMLDTGCKKIYCKSVIDKTNNIDCKNPCLNVSCCVCAPCVGLGTGLITMLSLPFLYLYKRAKLREKNKASESRIQFVVERGQCVSRVLHSSYNDPCDITIEIVDSNNTLCKIIKILAPKRT